MAIKLARWVQVAVIVVVAIALTYPFLVKGLVNGDDRPSHLEYQHFFSAQIAGGEFYPRWIPGLNLGRGSPIFFVQYPLPYYVAWGLGRVVPNHWGVYTETRSLGLGVVLAATFGALLTYAWCGTFSEGLSAMVASLVFITLPYFFSIDLYLRDAIGEAWALALMPLAFYFVERRVAVPRRSMAGLAAAFALVLFSHLFTAVLLVPVLFAYAGWRAEPGKRLSAMLHTASALLLGTALAGAYALPVIAHRHFLHPDNILNFLGANYSPLSQMFPYDNSTFPKDTPAWHFLSRSSRGLAAAIICLVVYACYRKRRERFLNRRTLLAVLSIATLGLTFMAGHLPALGAVSGAQPLSDYLANQRAHIFFASFVTLEGALVCYWFLRRHANRGLADLLIGIALLSYLMMTRWSLIVWTTFHPLWDMQFPWRFNVFLVLATTGLTALAISDLVTRPWRERLPGAVLALLVWGLVAGGAAAAGHVQDMFWGTQSTQYNPARDPALPVYAQVKNLQEALDIMPSKWAPIDAVVTAGTGSADVHVANPRLIELYARCQTDCTLRVGQFYYPAWRARFTREGPEIPLRATTPGGLMEISLPPGETAVVLELPRGWSERLGLWLSLPVLILLIALAFSDRAAAKSNHKAPLRGIAPNY